MRVAVFSDIHGNMHALEAVLDDISRQRVDLLVCAGDIPNPFLRSLDAWFAIKKLGIPIVRGNHEDYIASYFSEDRPEIRESVQFQPIQLVARHMGPEVAGELAKLPFDHLIQGPGGDDLYICHASPQHNSRSYFHGVDADMAAAFSQRVPPSARTVVAGHIHNPWATEWQGRNLLICGSVGLPHHGKPEAEYALLTHTGGAWQWEFRMVPYDAEAAMREYVESGAVDQGGPIAWMLYDELKHARPRLAFFLPTVLNGPGPRPTTVQEWTTAVKSALTSF